MDVVIDLERGAYYKNRQKLIKSNEMPKLSQAVSNLGKQLSNIVFQQCEEGLRIPFGLEPPLHGPGKELWISPSDLLIGKVCLKPPLTSKHIQALTHQGILDIGKKIEEKYWNEMEIAKETALLEQKQKFDEEFDLLLKQELKALQIEERLSCENKINELCSKFNTILFESLLHIEQRLFKKEKHRFKVFKQQLKEKYVNEQKRFMEREVQNVSKEFMKELQRNEEEMKENFVNNLKKMQWQMNNHVFRQKLQYENSLNRLRHSLECKNIANIMYVLCMERKKCAQEKEHFVQDYNREISKLKIANKQNTEKIVILMNKLEENYSQLHLREECLRELVKQYQKLIYFALRSAPTQAEFLLSVEQLLLFDLSETIKLSKEKFLKPCEEILPLNKEVDEEKTDVDENDLIVKDGHNCFDEVSVKETEENFIPAVDYNKHMYVREDFRNMLSQGLKIRPSNELWNKSLDNLMNHLNKKDQSKESINNMKTKSLLKNADEISLVHHNQVGINEKKPSILASRNSVELIHEKNPSLTSKHIVAPNYDTEPVLNVETKPATNEETKQETDYRRLETPSVCNVLKVTDSIIYGFVDKVKRKSSVRAGSVDSTRRTVSLKSNGVQASSSSSISDKSCCCKNKQCGSNKTKKSLRLSRRKTATITDSKPDELLKIYKPVQQKSSIADKFVNKISEATVVGNLDSKEYLLNAEQFTENRVRSLLTLIKDKPDLIGLFTAIVR